MATELWTDAYTTGTIGNRWGANGASINVFAEGLTTDTVSKPTWVEGTNWIAAEVLYNSASYGVPKYLPVITAINKSGLLRFECDDGEQLWQGYPSQAVHTGLGNADGIYNELWYSGMQSFDGNTFNNYIQVYRVGGIAAPYCMAGAFNIFLTQDKTTPLIDMSYMTRSREWHVRWGYVGAADTPYCHKIYFCFVDKNKPLYIACQGKCSDFAINLQTSKSSYGSSHRMFNMKAVVY